LLSAWFNTTLCVGLMFLVSRSNTLPLLWQVFGSANQMMGAMALLVAAVWLKDHGRRYIFVLVPSILMFATTLASTAMSLWKNQQLANWPLVIACGVLMLLGAGVAFLGARILLAPPRQQRAGH
jgi:carbon starvation protein